VKGRTGVTHGARPTLGVVLGHVSALLSAHDSSCAQELSCILEACRDRPVTAGPSSVSGCSAFSTALAGVAEPTQAILQSAADAFAWRIPGFGALPPDVGARMAAVAMIGPKAMIADNTAAAGLIVLDADLHYPEHCHAAEEVYLVLSGQLHWSIDGRSIGAVERGAFVHHRSWQSHAMTTGDAPALLLWGWTGDIRGETYTACQPAQNRAPAKEVAPAM
jgi:quercetin dioxygenase-like cupin family protein